MSGDGVRVAGAKSCVAGADIDVFESVDDVVVDSDDVNVRENWVRGTLDGVIGSCHVVIVSREQ